MISISNQAYDMQLSLHPGTLVRPTFSVNPCDIYPPTPWSPEAKGKARGEAVHGRDTKVRHELSPEVQANRGRSCVCVAEALVLVFLNGSKVRRHTVVLFRRFGRAAEGAV